mgnify:CR=1 FL=1|tara:strand:- start:93 stop:737 length:645 start_codon:yes stop_codon:yes gene_type:complete
MKIFISQNISKVKSYKEKVNYLSSDWSAFLEKNRPDLKIIPIPNIPKLVDEYYQYFKPDGLILSNGNDIGEFAERDNTEYKLIKKFVKEKKPILGVCRGFQILNYYFSEFDSKCLKRLVEDNHINKNHFVKICDEKFLFLKQNKIKVNSYHKYGVLKKKLAKNFKVFAIYNEDLVEGFFDSQRKIYGVQWHIERNSLSEQYDIGLLDMVFKKKL